MTYNTKIDKSGFEKDLKSISKAVKIAIGAITTTIAGISTYAIKVGSDFEEGMSKVQAISGATAEEIGKLTEKAKEMGAKTKFSATESADAFQYMAMAGWKTEDMLNGIEGIMNLAAASGEDLASVSDIVTDALTAFGLQAKDSGHFADVLAKASSNSNTNVGLMGETFKYVAPLAGSMKYSVEDTAVAIGLMANAGIKGSQAGTALRSMLTRLVKPPKDAAYALNKLNISAKNSDGTMKPLAQTMKELRAKFANLSESQKASYAASIAGQEAMSGMLAIVNASNDDFEKLTKAINNSDGAAKEMADTMNNNLKGSVTLLKSNLESLGIKIYEKMKEPLKKLVDTINKYISKIPSMLKKVYDWITKNRDVIKNLIKVVASLTAGMLAYKATLVAIQAIQTAKNILKTVSAFLSLIPTIRSAKDAMLLLNMTFSANPVGLLIAGITALIGIVTTLAISMNDSNKKTQQTFENMGKGASDFVTGISTAKSHLEDFNSELFASSEEQQQLQAQMDEVQAGITKICKTASDERRDYTQQEITQLNEYFQKLRELNEREIEIQQSIADAITQQAVTNAQTFQGSLKEYEQQSKQWLKTAEEQKTKTIDLINKQSIEETALLNQRYGEQANMQNENYANEYNEIVRQKEEKIAQAQEEVGQIQQTYANGYLERSIQEDGWYQKVQEVNKKLEDENNRYAEAVKATKDSELFTEGEKNLELLKSKSNHNDKVQKIWKEMYKGMTEEQANELGVWIGMLAQTEMYGEDISKENKEMVDTILGSYDNMPEKTREAMKDAMSPMLTEMESKEPSLFAKASGIAEGILSRLKTSFQIQSPSKKMRKLFNYVMQGAELGLEDEKDNLTKQIDEISNDVYRKMQNAVALETGAINARASIKANNSMLNVVQATFNVDGSVNIDGQKAGRIITPYMTKTLRVGGVY